MEARRGGPGVPEDLGVVVGVGVDEAGADDLAGGVVGLDGLGAGEVAGGGDAPVGYAHVGRHAGCARAVDHRAAGNEQVEHGGGGYSPPPPSS